MKASTFIWPLHLGQAMGSASYTRLMSMAQVWLQRAGGSSSLSGFVHGAIHQWDTATGRPLTPQAAADSAIDQIVSTPDGRRILSRDEASFTTVWDRASGTRLLEQLPDNTPADCVAYSPDGHAMATATPDGTVSVWKTDGWVRVAQVQGHRNRVADLHFARDGQLLSGGMDTTIFAWEIPTLDR